MEFDSKDNAKTMHEDDDDRPKMTPSSKTRPNFEPFSLQQSREDFYDTKKIKHPPPPCGFYNPRFAYTEKMPRTLFKYGKEKSKPQFFSTMTDFSVEEATQPLPDKLHKKIVGPTPFHLQTVRSPVTSPGNNPHESRFTFIDFPKNLGKNKRPLTVDMNKSRGRDTKLMYKTMEYSPDYNPNFEFGRKGLGNPGPKFEKKSSRKSVIIKSASINEEPFDPSLSETFKYQRPRTSLFENYSPRYTDPTSPLPSFMQKSISSRIAVGTFRQKALETNNYSDGKFQTVHSGFSPSKSPKAQL